MRQQVRLRVLVPIVVVALAGLGFVKFGLGAVGLGPDTPEPAAATAPASDPAAAPETQDATTTEEAGSTEPVSESGGMQKLEAALADHKVVVLVLYSPNATVDSLISRDARLAAEDVGAGFVAVNATKEQMVGELALTFDLRETPAVLVFTRGPELRTRLVGYADRETVAQAAQNARRA